MEPVPNTLPVHQQTFSVAQSFVGSRIDHFLSELLPQYSRSFLQKLIMQSRVYKNNQEVTKHTRLKLHDIITIIFPEQDISSTNQYQNYDFGVNIISEHEHFLIIEKPAGLVIHPPAHQSSCPTLIDWIMIHVPMSSTVGCAERPGIVHRLDKDTSGLMIIARTSYAHSQFTQMFKQRTIHKTYHAYVQGHTDTQGSIQLPIGRHPVHRTKMATYTSDMLNKNKQVRSALTHYRAVTYFQEYTLLELKPVTGRTHQIRVHCASIGHALLGDQTYGKKSSFITRHALHASGIAFSFDGIFYEFTAPFPNDFKMLNTILSRVPQVS